MPAKALRLPDPPAPARAPAPPRETSAIDRGHLRRQSLGDAALERELLELYDRQAARIAAELLLPDLSDAERSERRDLAHTLKGSSRAIGAWGVALACESYEAAIDERRGRLCVETAACGIRDAVHAVRLDIAAAFPAGFATHLANPVAIS